MRVRLGGKYYQLTSGRPSNPNSFAHVDWDAKIILINPAVCIDNVQLLETIIHECFHASFPFLDEDTIEHEAHNLTIILAKLGVTIDPPPSQLTTRSDPL